MPDRAVRRAMGASRKDMSVSGNFVAAIAGVIEVVLNVYMWVVIAAALITWVSPDPRNPIVRFLYSVTEPAFRLVRRVLPVQITGIDFSPFIVLMVIYFLQRFVPKTLYELAMNL